jgi:hypothetical protein
MTRIGNLDGIATRQRRLICESLRKIAHGSHTLMMLANAAGIAVHEDSMDAVEELEKVNAGIQALQHEADEIARQIEWHPSL